MNPITAYLLVPLFGLLLLPFLKSRHQGILVILLLAIGSFITSIPAIQSLTGERFYQLLTGSYTTGAIPIRIDALSGWFILIVNLIFLTGSIYGYSYLKSYGEKGNSFTLHYSALLLQHASIIGICSIQNSFVFLIAWEILALTSFVLIIFEHENAITIKAGINYLIQAHFSIIFLMVAFIWVTNKTGSYDFEAITSYSANLPENGSLILFLLFFIAFAIKAGFIPFHTWLPQAHPAAPSHISGMMSGVIIKVGIYGILRMLLVVKSDYTTIGYLILIVSVFSGLYGVMLAIVQHNLKKLLAYHSIENIGIIGIGIALGSIGIGTGNQFLATLGFAGALLHTLNHALFKSLLFYTAGNVYQATHTMNIESLGGLAKKMPQTSILFLVAAIAICGIPPFNGFISEFILYNGLYKWLLNGTLFSLLAAIFSTISLVAIGGLAILCFTKAFGTIFLGNCRRPIQLDIKEVNVFQLIPSYLLAIVMLFIGLAPKVVIHLLSKTIAIFSGTNSLNGIFIQTTPFENMQSISWASGLLLLMILAVYLTRRILTRKLTKAAEPTWGCGYTAPTTKQQYTAGSFVRTYSKLFGPVLLIKKEEEAVRGIIPSEASYKTHPLDKIEHGIIDRLVKQSHHWMGKFAFLNNGKLQFYILYGILFIVTVLSIPLIYQKIEVFIAILKHL